MSSIGPLEIGLAQHPRNIDSSARPLEDYAIISSPKPVEVLFVALQFLDALAIRNRVVRETSTIGKNLIRDLGWLFVEVVLRLLGEKNPEGHAYLALPLRRRLM